MSNDLEIIKRIEKLIESKLKQVSLESLFPVAIYSFKDHNKITSNCFSVNEEKQVVGLSLEGIYINWEMKSEIVRLTNLKYIVFQNSYETGFLFLKDLKCLTRLALYLFEYLDIEFLKDLKRLTHLSLIEAKGSPDYFPIGYLTNLTHLDLGGDTLMDINFLSNLQGLVDLNLCDNHEIRDYSPIKSLPNLRGLDLSFNSLFDLSFLEGLTTLSRLSITLNPEIKDYSTLCHLPNLSDLSICNNDLTDISFLRDLKNLRFLDISRNYIRDVSVLAELPNLEDVILEDNPIKNPPVEIASKGIEAIRNYFKQIEKQGSTRLYEAKLLLVGEPGAGKTTLRKKIMDPDYQVSKEGAKEGESTLGIEIESGWKFDHCDDKAIPFRTHMWDFGGQPIQYMLHQYFLTSRSLYVLVSDDRKQHTRFDYWFDIIKVLGDKSPVLVVLNENKHRSISDFDFKGYGKRYAGDYMLEKRDVDLSKSDGRFEELKEKIREMLCHLEHIGDELPGQWLPIRRELEKIKDENQIGIQRYFEICRTHGLDSEEDMLNLCGYLNALGVVLHYRDDASLEDTLFINPLWIMDGLYTVLVDKTLEKGQGKFDKKWLFGIWEEKGYSYEERCKLFNLMLKDNFELCYPISGKKDKYMVPLLLPDVPPDYESPSGEGLLNFRFQYPIFPEGIIPRLLVRLNEYIEKKRGKDLIWKKGGLLRKGENRALVREDRSSEGLAIIDISVSGEINSNRDFLAQIRGEIEKIHKKSFKGIDYEEMIPCNCEQCKAKDTTYFFKFSELKRYIISGESYIKCSLSVDSVSIQELISGIMSFRGVILENATGQFRNILRTHGYPSELKDSVKLIESIMQTSKREPPKVEDNPRDLDEGKNIQKKIEELKEKIKREENRKKQCDKDAEKKINRRDWLISIPIILVLIAWGILIVAYDWNVLEKWTYLIGSLIFTIVYILYFTIKKKAYSRAENRALRLEKEKKKGYQLYGVDLNNIERLKQELADAENRQKEILN